MGAEERDIEAMWERSSASRRRRPDATHRKLCPRGPRVRQDTGFVTELRGPSPDLAHVYSFYCIMVSFKEIYLYHFGFQLHLLKTKRDEKYCKRILWQMETFHLFTQQNDGLNQCQPNPRLKVNGAVGPESSTWPFQQVSPAPVGTGAALPVCQGRLDTHGMTPTVSVSPPTHLSPCPLR